MRISIFDPTSQTQVGDQGGDIQAGGGGRKILDFGGKSKKTSEEEAEEILFARAEKDWGGIKAIELKDMSGQTLAPGEVAEGAGKIKAADFFMGYEEAMGFFKGLDRTLVGPLHTSPLYSSHPRVQPSHAEASSGSNTVRARLFTAARPNPPPAQPKFQP